MGAGQAPACCTGRGGWETAVLAIWQATETGRCARRWPGTAGGAGKLAAYSAEGPAGGGAARSTGLILVAGS